MSRELGRGAFGRALLVKRRSDGYVAVMKEISLEGMPLSERKASESEVKILKKLKKHPNIVAFMDSFMENKKLHIVMEWAKAGDLAAVIKSTKTKRALIPETRVLTIFVQCVSALNFMHSHHVLHRDIKPANIFLTSQGDQVDIVKLGDFGIAKVLAHTMARAKTVAGTPYYMAPELCREKPYSNMADVWSLGCVLHELCALDVPFTATSMAALVRKIVGGKPRRLTSKFSQIQPMVDKMLSKDGSKRPSMKRLLSTPLLQQTARMLADAAIKAASAAPAPSSSRKAAASAAKQERKQPAMDNLQDRLAKLKKDLENLGGGGEAAQRTPMVNPALRAEAARNAQMRRNRAGLPRVGLPRVVLPRAGLPRPSRNDKGHHNNEAAEHHRRQRRQEHQVQRKKARAKEVEEEEEEEEEGWEENARKLREQVQQDRARFKEEVERKKKEEVERRRRGERQEREQREMEDQKRKENREAELLKARREQQKRKELAKKKEIERIKALERAREVRAMKAAKKAQEAEKERQRRKELENAWVELNVEEEKEKVRAAGNERDGGGGGGGGGNNNNGDALPWYKSPPQRRAGQEQHSHDQQEEERSPAVDKEMRRKIWEENQAALARNRMRAKEVPTNLLMEEEWRKMVEEVEKEKQKNQRPRGGERAVQLDPELRRKIWEENQLAVKKNARAAADAAAPPVAPSTPTSRDGRLMREGGQGLQSPSFPLKPPLTEDVYLARLEKARKQAFEERLLLKEKYRGDGGGSGGGGGGGGGGVEETAAEFVADVAESVADEILMVEEEKRLASSDYVDLAESMVSMLMDHTIEIDYDEDSDDDDDGDDGDKEEDKNKGVILSKPRAEWEMEVVAGRRKYKEEGDVARAQPATKQDSSSSSPSLPVKGRRRRGDPEKKERSSGGNDGVNGVVGTLSKEAPPERKGRRPRRPRMDLPKEEEVIPASFQPPTPLGDCNSALAQLAKDLTAQEQRANLQKGELIRTALENVLGELGFLRLYRATRMLKRQATSRTAKVHALMDTVPQVIAQNTQRGNGATKKVDSRMVAEQMLGLLDLEDNN